MPYDHIVKYAVTLRLPRWCSVHSKLAGSYGLGVVGIQGLIIDQRGQFDVNQLCIDLRKAKNRWNTRHAVVDSIFGQPLTFPSGGPEKILR